jgi:DNA segregation ATPase FtsK/SpoIIIE, S-DNA-T family
MQSRGCYPNNEAHFWGTMSNMTEAKPHLNETVKPALTPEQLAVLATLQVKLSSLGVEGHFLPSVSVGPIITLYKFVPQNATRVSLVERLSDDMAIALGVEAVQVKRIPGEAAIGIYVPNKDKKLILFRDCVGSVWEAFNKRNLRIPILFGINHMGEMVVEDLTLLPHLLIAGATGSGKSTFINSILASLIYTAPPDKIKMVLSDVKQVEFTHFCGAPHLLYPVSTSIPETLEQMEWVIDEVNRRLGVLARAGCQNILQFNAVKPPLPYIVFVIDELAEILMDQSNEEMEIPDGEGGTKIKLVKRGKLAEHRLGLIAQKARAGGVHLIAATQRPSVKVVEGNIKSNFPARVSFRLPSEADSRTILGTGGAEQLLSQGDMLYLSPNTPAIRRLHAPLASREDISAAIEVACRRQP